MRRVLIDPAARRLPPGDVFLEIVAAPAVIDALGARPELTNRLAEIVVRSTPGAEWLGGGKQWSPDENGEPRLVYGGRIRVAETPTEQAVALAGPAVVPLVITVSLLLLSAGFFVREVRFFLNEGDDVAEPVQAVAGLVEQIGRAALIAGGLTVAYIVARRQGWLA